MKPCKILVFLTLATISSVLVIPANAQVAPPLGFVDKLGRQVDVRSGGRILQDELGVGISLGRCTHLCCYRLCYKVHISGHAGATSGSEESAPLGSRSAMPDDPS